MRGSSKISSVGLAVQGSIENARRVRMRIARLAVLVIHGRFRTTVRRWGRERPVTFAKTGLRPILTLSVTHSGQLRRSRCGRSHDSCANGSSGVGSTNRNQENLPDSRDVVELKTAFSGLNRR
jgi:hypothetical protein